MNLADRYRGAYIFSHSLDICDPGMDHLTLGLFVVASGTAAPAFRARRRRVSSGPNTVRRAA